MTPFGTIGVQTMQEGIFLLLVDCNLRAGPQYLSEGEPALAPTTPKNWKDLELFSNISQYAQKGFFKKPEPPLFGMSRKSVLQPAPSEQSVAAAVPRH